MGNIVSRRKKAARSGDDIPEAKVVLPEAEFIGMDNAIGEYNEGKIDKYYEKYKWTFVQETSKKDVVLNQTAPSPQDRVMDILLIMDCTASMSPWISLCKQTLTKIIDAAKDDHPELSVRVAFVGYRDFMDKDSLFYIHDFSLETEKLKSFISKAKDKGGNDIPEDLQGALHQGLKLNWRKNSIKVCHVCTDAPAHGKTYHSVSDDHPKGNPAGLVLEDLMLKYSNFEVDVTLYHLTDQTTKMFELMKGAYNQGSKEDGFEIIDLREKLQEARRQGEDVTAPTSNFYSGYVASVSHDVAARRHNSYTRRGWS